MNQSNEDLCTAQSDSEEETDRTVEVEVIKEKNNTRSHLQRYLAASDAAPPMTVEFKNMTAKVPASINSKEMKTILNNVSGIIKPGEFVALMGPSGAGKSSLLNILGSRFDAENGECSGEILINGQPRSKKFKKYIGYVLQRDFILPNLTVRETLEITAKLRLPSILTLAEKLQRVEDIIQVMGLQSCANTMVQKVSGGESKRVSIANEMLINPSVLFLDEPTSGLDSTTAFSILSTLKELCVQGRTIICAIHQPSSQMFAKFDKLFLLASGEMIYFGDIHSSTDYFASHGFECPMHFNPADYILELITDNFTSEDESMQDKKEIKEKLIQAWKEHKSILPVSKMDVNAGTLDIKKITINEDGEEKEIAIIDHSSMIDTNSRWHSSWFEQFLILFVRAYKHRRGHLWSKVQAIQMFCVGFFLGLVWFQIPSTEDNLQDWVGANYFIQVYVGFSVMYRGVVYFPVERSVVKKERHSGAYRMSAYYFGKICAESPVDMLFPIICCTIFYWLVGFSFDFPTYLWYIVSTCLGIAAANSFGIFLGCSVQNFNDAIAMLVVFGMLMMALMGYLVKDRAIPVWISWLKYASIFRYQFLVTLWSVLNVTKFECGELSEYETCNSSDSDGYIHAKDILEAQQVDEEYWMAAVMLLVLMTFWYSLGFCFIRRNTRTKTLTIV